MQFKFGETYTDTPVNLGDTVQLQKGDPIEIVECQESGVKMLHIDADQIQSGDLKFIKSLGLTISNPDTDKPVALGVDYIEDSWGHKIHDYLTNKDDDSEDDSDDSSFFSGGSFLAGLGSSGFSGSSFGGFGGFGGGSFSGGGASSSF
jgi:hypothetical protein